MTNVPRVAPVDNIAFRSGRTMTFSTKLVQRRGGKFARIVHSMMLRVGRVLRARPMTAFTSNAALLDPDVALLLERHRSRRVTFKTASNAEVRIVETIEHAGGLRDGIRMHGFLSGSWTVGICCRVPRCVMFNVPVLIHPGHESACLTACAKNPIEREFHPVCAIVDANLKAAFRMQDLVTIARSARDRHAHGKARMICSARKSRRMRARRLGCEFRGMACLARFSACVGSCGRHAQSTPSQ